MIWYDSVSMPGPGAKGLGQDTEDSEDGSQSLKRALAIGSSRYDTCLDQRLCNLLGRPAGNIGPLLCDSIDLSPFVAFRPSEVIQVHPDGVAGVMGINLLENFRIHVDRQSLMATVRAARSARFPSEELKWFQAMVSEDRDLVQAWLEEYAQRAWT